MARTAGEFSKYGAYAGQESMCSEAGEVLYQKVLEETAQRGVIRNTSVTPISMR